MARAAVFVDAGYVFAQGGHLLAGQRTARDLLQLDVPQVAGLAASMVAETCRRELLRIYWYDAVRAGQLSDQHAAIAHAHDFKLRLGQLNSSGEQKGVDALIITDLLELARNGAISDALLVSGDEDLRIGVSLAQQHGVRVHLIGVHPARSNQSRSLRQEVDTTREWDAGTVRRILSLVEPAVPPAVDEGLERGIGDLLNAMSPEDLQAAAQAVRSGRTVPAAVDRDLLRLGRSVFGRPSLTDQERARLRAAFKTLVLPLAESRTPPAP